MGFIERMLVGKAERVKRVDLEIQRFQIEKDAREKYEEELTSSRQRSLDYFLESIYPKLFVDFHIIEPSCIVTIRDFEEEEWVQREGSKLVDWIHVKDLTPSIFLPRKELSAHVSWGAPYLYISCHPDGTIACGNQTMTHKEWRNDPNLQEKAFEEAYRNPWYRNPELALKK